MFINLVNVKLLKLNKHLLVDKTGGDYIGTANTHYFDISIKYGRRIVYNEYV
jgi:hypothetical protein